jgi:LysM repeat protein
MPEMNGSEDWPSRSEPPPQDQPPARERTVYRVGSDDVLPDGPARGGPTTEQLPGASAAVESGPWSLGPPAPPSYRRSRHIARFVAPVAFLALVVGLVAVIMKSGVLGPDGGLVVSPSASVSASPSAKPVTYKVVKGDTLTLIAVKHHTSVDKILQLNPDLSINSLRVGETIILPPPQ